QVRRGGLSGERLRWRARAQLDQGYLARGHEPRRHREPGSAGAVRGGRRGRGHRWSRPRPRHLSDGCGDRTRGLREPQRDGSRRARGSIARRARGGCGPVTVPFYVSPEQVMKDRADYARKNLARGRDLVAFETADGVVIITENQYPTLHKISEVYDRIAFG